MKRTANSQPLARRLTVRHSGVADASSELEVECPLVNGNAVLQRCAFCEHGRGLLLDPRTNSLTLQCSFSDDG